MDYPYFTAAPQPYQFLGLPPTPAHTGSANSDDFSNSPPVRSQPFSYVTYQSPTSLTTKQQDAFDQFQSFDYNPFTASNGLPPQDQNKPPTPQHKPSIVSANNGFEMPADMNNDEMRRGSNSDDDDNMTPAQSRRKAQNRAAYVPFLSRILSRMSSPSYILKYDQHSYKPSLTNQSANEPSANAKNATLKTSKPNSQTFRRTPKRSPSKTSV